MSAALDLICSAIRQHKHVIADYEGYPREMCPHVAGHGLRGECALFYQYAGGSKSGLGPDGSPQNWRCIVLGGLANIRLVDRQQWHTAPDHSRPQTCVKHIICEVSF